MNKRFFFISLVAFSLFFDTQGAGLGNPCWPDWTSWSAEKMPEIVLSETHATVYDLNQPVVVSISAGVRPGHKIRYDRKGCEDPQTSPYMGMLTSMVWTVNGSCGASPASGQGSTARFAVGNIGTGTVRFVARGIVIDPDHSLSDSTHVPISVGGVDLDIDSDNNNEMEPPDRTLLEELLEVAPDVPGKLMMVNDEDLDGDGIPEYADGFNRDDQAGTDDDESAQDDFVPLVLDLSEEVDPFVAKLKITYDDATPAEVTYDPTNGWAPGSGALRLWTKDGNQARNKNSVKAIQPGDFVPAGEYPDPSELGFSSTIERITLYVEGIEKSTTVGDQRIKVELDPDGTGPLGWQWIDELNVTVFGGLDLDIDSDNNNGFLVPDRSVAEEQIEDHPSKPGKLVAVNDLDTDEDDIPDYADGFDWDGLAGNDDNSSLSNRFVPLILELPPVLDLSNAKIKMSYAAAAPTNVSYDAMNGWTTGAGKLRIWTKNGHQVRNKNSVLASNPPGDFVPPGEYADLSKLGLSNSNRMTTLYVEGIAESRREPIEVFFDPDGAGPEGWVLMDRVRLDLADFKEVAAEDVRLLTQIDRINGQSCPQSENLIFTLSHGANVRIEIDQSVVTNGLFAAGANEVMMTTHEFPLPGEHPFKITAVYTNDPSATPYVTEGKIHHEIQINASYPIGHTFIKGVDIWDGHFTHSSQDIQIPGRGPSLDFARTYSSAGHSDSGVMGAGWTHSYHSRLIQDHCGRFTVIGGEGSGNVFTLIEGEYVPQIGYHSTLVQDGTNNAFNFYTKAHILYRFEAQTLGAREYNLQYIEDPNGNRVTLEYATDGDPATLDKVTDASGRSLLFKYELKGWVKRITRISGTNSLTGGNLLGLEMRYTYDNHGNLTQVTRVGTENDDQRVQSYAYAVSDTLTRNNMTQYTDPNGNSTDIVYYPATNILAGVNLFGGLPTEVVKEVRESEQVTTGFTYDFEQGTRTVGDPRAGDPNDPHPPSPAVYTLNPYGAVTRIQEPLGKVTVMEWGTDGPTTACLDRNGTPSVDVLMIRKVDPEGREHLYEYDEGLGNLIREQIRFLGEKAPVTLKDGTTPVLEIVVSHTYETTFSKRTSSTDAQGNTTYYTIDPGTGNLLSTENAAGHVTTFDYETNGDLKTITDPRGLVTQMPRHNAYGNVEEIIDPEGNITTNRYDERSRLIEMSDSFTHHVVYEYDGLNRKIKEQRKDDLGEGGPDQITTYSYLPNGELEALTNGLGHVTQFSYDTLNRKRSEIELNVTHVQGSVTDITTSYEYDRNSNLIRETDPRGVVTLHEYDELDRLIKTEIDGPFTPNQLLFGASYDRVDNQLSETNMQGHTLTYTYDGLYRVVETILPHTHGFTNTPFAPQAKVQVAYDRLGNIVRQTDSNGYAATNVYDNLYRLIKQTDADGNSITYQYDAANNKTREEHLNRGLLIEWPSAAYDGLNRPQLMKQTVPLGGTNQSTVIYETSYTYLDSANATETINPRGFKSKIDKDGLDRTVREILDVGGLDLTTSYTYDGNGNVLTFKDAQGNDVDLTYAYDGLNRKIRTTYLQTSSDASAPTEEFYYDGNNNLVRMKDKRGTIFENSYDNLNRPLTTSLLEPLSNQGQALTLATYVYDDPNSQVSQTDANGNQMLTYSDGLGRAIRIVDPLFEEQTFEYDGVNLRVEIDKKGQKNEYDYDALNRQVQIREFDVSGALASSFQSEYIDEQNQVKATDRRGIVRMNQMDGLGRVMQTGVSDLGLVAHYGAADVTLETYEYDENSNKTLFKDALGNETRWIYDSLDRQESVIEGFGSPVVATTTYTYDNVKNVLTVKDGRDHGGVFDVTNTYDARYRLISSKNAEGETVTQKYDANNNRIQTTDPKGSGYVTTYEYDELNKLLAVDERARGGGVTRFFYDGNRNLIAQQDANNNLVTLEYDALNRLTDRYQHTVAGTLSSSSFRGANPRGSDLSAGGDMVSALHWRYSYGLNGNQTSITDARGQLVTKTYDYLDRLITKSYTNHAEPDIDFQPLSITYGYDLNNNITNVIEVKQLGIGTITEITISTYDPLNRLQTKAHRDYDDPTGKLIQFDYDRQGNRTKLIDPDGLTTTYTYDERNRLNTVTNEAGLTTYTWYPDNLLKSTKYPNGTLCDRSASDAYDHADRLLHTLNRSTNGITFSAYSYTYDTNGNRLTQIEMQSALHGGQAETNRYEYDLLNRLTRVIYGSTGDVAYTYAANGNRLSEMGTDPHTGNLMHRTYEYSQLPGLESVTFDHVNTLTRITDHIAPSNSVAYEYDANFNQIAKTKAGVRTTFDFSIRDHLLRADELAGTATSFDYNDLGLRTKKISESTGKETRYLYDDSAVLLEYDGDATGLPTTHKYDYGYELLSLTQVDGANRESQFYLKDTLMSTVNLTDESGGLLHSYRYDAWGRIRNQVGTSENPRQFTGHYKDDETGLHYFGARYYDDEIGRFISQDPYLGQQTAPPSLHRYLYALNNPLKYVDPDGRIGILNKVAAMLGKANKWLKKQVGSRQTLSGQLYNYAVYYPLISRARAGSRFAQGAVGLVNIAANKISVTVAGQVRASADQARELGLEKLADDLSELDWGADEHRKENDQFWSSFVQKIRSVVVEGSALDFVEKKLDQFKKSVKGDPTAYGELLTDSYEIGLNLAGGGLPALTRIGTAFRSVATGSGRAVKTATRRVRAKIDPSYTRPARLQRAQRVEKAARYAKVRAKLKYQEIRDMREVLWAAKRSRKLSLRGNEIYQLGHRSTFSHAGWDGKSLVIVPEGTYLTFMEQLGKSVYLVDGHAFAFNRAFPPRGVSALPGARIPDLTLSPLSPFERTRMALHSASPDIMPLKLSELLEPGMKDVKIIGCLGYKGPRRTWGDFLSPKLRKKVRGKK